MRRLFAFLCWFMAPALLYGQEAVDSTVLSMPDTAAKTSLPEVLVRAFQVNQGLLETPASVNLVNKQQLERYNTGSILPAVNSKPGVRMEERSPGSYRLNIRGSSLRSPFGVRNVKVYYNDIPLTDPGGSTYLNQLGYYNFQSLEIIKGPGSSMYGAGTGGVMLINSLSTIWTQGVNASYTGGSYNLTSGEAELRIGDSSFQNVIRYQHQSSDGYRAHSSLRHDVGSWDATLKHNNHSELSVHFLYGDLYYQTPGALTLAEYTAAPRAARPTVGNVPGAEANNAGVDEKMFLAGFTYKQQFSRHWGNATTVYGLYSQLRNPTIANYARSSEPNFGGRSTFSYQTTIGGSTLQWLIGAEAQQGFTSLRTYENRNGNPDTLQAEDEINSRQMFGFAQLSWQLRKWIFTAGLSVSQLHIVIARLTTLPYAEQQRDFNGQRSPRFAVLCKILQQLSVYGTISRGYSPPTTAELSPSGQEINLQLNPEEGWNYELGFRGSMMDKRLSFDVSGFYFNLFNTIVQRRDVSGGSYFVNSGSTDQLGVEAFVNYELISGGVSQFDPCNAWLAYTGYHFRYRQFMQVNIDYSGKSLPSVAPNTLATGIDITNRMGLYLNLSYYYSDKIPLNDANAAYAKAYHLVNARFGFKKHIARVPLDIYVGGNNLLNQKYSLGNDINGFSGRYYNAAAAVNFFAGISIGYNWKRG